MKNQKISDAVIRRLPRYYRQLDTLVQNGVERVSSSELAAQLKLNPSQVRQDFNCFGDFGQQGYGYHVRALHQEIGTILGLTHSYSMVVAGAGNIAHALCKYDGFSKLGFHIMAVFDKDPALFGRQVAEYPIQDVEYMGAYIREHEIDIGIITARRNSAQSLADSMVASGIKGIWNFVPVDLAVSVPVQNVHLSDSMLVLSYLMNWKT